MRAQHPVGVERVERPVGIGTTGRCPQRPAPFDEIGTDGIEVVGRHEFDVRDVVRGDQSQDFVCVTGVHGRRDPRDAAAETELAPQGDHATGETIGVLGFQFMISIQAHRLERGL